MSGPSAPSSRPRPRRALASLGGPTHTRGEAGQAAVLREAMERAAVEAPDGLTHGMHPWPARMHPAIARVVIAAASRPGDRVLDPFCGSGTVLLEAMLAGRRSVGVDLNPLAPALVAVKCERRSEPERRRLLETAMRLAEASIARVRARAPAFAPLPPSMRGLYGPHTLREMAGLLDEIRAVQHEADRRALEIVFSSLVVKVSNKRGETASGGELRKRIRKGLVTELFVRKCEELVQRWAALAEAVPPGMPEPRVFVGDALRLPRILGPRTRVDLVLCSPPYGGTYDYHAQHALRLAWLGLDGRGIARHEIGARRSLRGSPEQARARWDAEVGAMLRAMRAVLRPQGAIVLLIGDGRFGPSQVPAIPQLEALAPATGLEPIASASQPRPDWSGGGSREEHLVMLRIAPAAGRRRSGSFF